MNIAMGIAFLCFALVFIILASLAILNIGFARLESSFGIARDGIPPGRPAPRWSIKDSNEIMRKTPTNDRWQFLIFTDNSLQSFPDLVSGINQIILANPELEVLLLSRTNLEVCKIMARVLEMHAPIVPVDRSFYNRFRVRVMPFAFLLDPAGTIHQAGLVNTSTQLFKMWQSVQEIVGEQRKLEGVAA